MAGDDGVNNNDQGASNTAEATPSINAILEALAHDRRRIILSHLIESDTGVATVDELVSHIIDEETRVSDEIPASGDINAQLHHIHLSKLIYAGVVEYDVRSQELRYYEAPRLEKLLKFIESEIQNE